MAQIIRQLILKQFYRAIDFEGVIVPGVYYETDPKLQGRAQYLVDSARAEWLPEGSIVIGDQVVSLASIAPAPTGENQGEEAKQPEKPKIDPAVYAGLNKAQLMELGERHDLKLPQSLRNEEMIEALIVKGITPEGA